jgi:hypothetical protein
VGDDRAQIVAGEEMGRKGDGETRRRGDGEKTGSVKDFV